jgi:hypothetical protein
MTDERFNEFVKEVENLSASQRALLKAQVLMNAELQEQQLRTEKSFVRVNEGLLELKHEVSELTASVKITDANVAALVTMHRQLLEGKNGKQ